MNWTFWADRWLVTRRITQSLCKVSHLPRAVEPCQLCTRFDRFTPECAYQQKLGNLCQDTSSHMFLAMIFITSWGELFNFMLDDIGGVCQVRNKLTVTTQKKLNFLLSWNNNICYEAHFYSIATKNEGDAIERKLNPVMDHKHAPGR